MYSMRETEIKVIDSNDPIILGHYFHLYRNKCYQCRERVE